MSHMVCRARADSNSGLHLELDLPVSGLDKFEGLVGLPDFGGEFAPEDYDGNATSHYQQHFATQIVLRRLSVSFNSSMLAGRFLPHSPFPARSS